MINIKSSLNFNYLCNNISLKKNGWFLLPMASITAFISVYELPPKLPLRSIATNTVLFDQAFTASATAFMAHIPSAQFITKLWSPAIIILASFRGLAKAKNRRCATSIAASYARTSMTSSVCAYTFFIAASSNYATVALN